MPSITLIAAVDKNRAIGYQNKLLYRLPNDLKRFKEITTGHTVIMGRKTFLSLPKGALPNRRNIVLSRTLKEAYPNTEVFPSLVEALNKCNRNEKVFIMGGEMLYKEGLDIANELLITEIDSTVEKADAFFPKFKRSEWDIIDIENHPADETHSFDFSYIKYRKIK